MSDISKQKRMPIKRQLQLGTIIGLALGALFIITHPIQKTKIDVKAKYQLSELQRNVIDALVVDEVTNILAENPSAFSLQDLGVMQVINARSLAAKYEANEVSADNEFKDKYFVVRGAVQGITKDFAGDPGLLLAGKNMFLNVHAHMDEKELPNLAEIQKGDTVSLICRGNGMVIGSPILEECRYSFSALKQRMVDRINDFLDGDLLEDRKIAVMLSYGLYGAQNLPEDTACHGADAKECFKSVDASFRLMQRPNAQNQDYLAILQSFKIQGLVSEDMFGVIERTIPQN